MRDLLGSACPLQGDAFFPGLANGIDCTRRSGEWCGITFRQDYQRVQSIIASLIADGRYPKELWA